MSLRQSPKSQDKGDIRSRLTETKDAREMSQKQRGHVKEEEMGWDRLEPMIHSLFQIYPMIHGQIGFM